MASGPEIARGHALAVGAASGRVLAIEPVSLWGGVAAESGAIIDVHHPALGTSIAQAVLVMTHGRGSSSASAILAETLRLGTGPAAILLRSPDMILAVGSVVARELYGVECPIVHLEADAFDAVAALAGEHVRVVATTSAATIARAT